MLIIGNYLLENQKYNESIEYFKDSVDIFERLKEDSRHLVSGLFL